MTAEQRRELLIQGDPESLIRDQVQKNASVTNRDLGDETDEHCPRCYTVMVWRHASLQCPKCTYKEGCCG